MDNDNSELIPCEVCNQLIQASQYYDHVSTDHDDYINNDDINNDDIEERLEDIHNDDDIRRLSYYINRSNQVPISTISQFITNGLNRRHVNSPTPPSVLLSMLNISDFLDDKVEIGLTDDEISQVSDIVEKHTNDNEEMCSICLEKFDVIIADKKDLRKLKCTHTFCDECILKWLKKHKKCPLCQTDLEDTYIKLI